jgi:hypothetical protein
LQPLFKTDAITPTDCIQLFVVAKTLVAIGSKSSSANKICTNETYKLEPLKVYVYWDVIKKFGGFEERNGEDRIGYFKAMWRHGVSSSSTWIHASQETCKGGQK